MIEAKVFLDPEAYGLEICTNCAGFGSSLHEGQRRCSECNGNGLVQAEVSELRAGGIAHHLGHRGGEKNGS